MARARRGPGPVARAQVAEHDAGVGAALGGAGPGLLGQLGEADLLVLQIDLAGGRFDLGWPRLSDSAVELFRSDYRLPFIAPEPAALLAATAEHVLPVLLLLGLGTRLAALGLLAMTAVIQFFVYPGAYPTHGTWAAALLWLVARGPGVVSIDHGLARCFEAEAQGRAADANCR